MAEVQAVKAKGTPLEAGAGGALPWLWFFGLSRADGGSILGSLRGAAVLLIGLLLGFPAGGQAQTTTITAERYDGNTWQSVTSGSEDVRLTRLTGSGHTISGGGNLFYSMNWCLRKGANAGTAEYETDWGFRSTQTSPSRNGLNQNLCATSWTRGNVPTVEKWLDITDDNMDEPDETIKFSIAGGSSASGSANFQYTIKDNDPTIVSLAKVGSATTLTEGNSLRFTVTLGRELVAGEVIDVPLSLSGTNVTTGDWSLSLVPGSALSAINVGVTLADAATATPKLTFSGPFAQVATLEWRAIAEDPPQAENPETVTIALGPDGSGANGFDRTTLGTNVGGGADPHGTNNEFSITVEDPVVNPVTIERFPFDNTEEMVDIRENIQTGRNSIQVTLRASGFTLPTDGSTWSWTWCVRTGEDAGTATYGTDWVFVTSSSDFTPRQLTNNCYSGPANTSVDIIGIFSNILITDDMIDEPIETIKVSFEMTGGATGIANYTVNIMDDDPTIVSLTSQFGTNPDGSNINGSLKEGDIALFQVSLGRELVAEEVVEMSLNIGGTDVTTGDWSLALSPLNHPGTTLQDADTATPKLRLSGAGAREGVLTWTATPDKTAESPEVVTIALGSRTLNTNVQGFNRYEVNTSSTNNRFTITVEDPSIAITETDATTVTEAAGESRTDTYTVVLKAQPSAAVEVAVASSDTATATVSPASLSFSTSLWNTPQTVTVTAVDDDLDQGNRTVTLTHAATSTDTDYNEVFIRNVTATVVDDDRAGLTITHSGGSTTVTEAAGATRTDTYTVALSSEPTHGVELTLSSYRTTVATVSPTSLTFTTINWNAPQTVTVTGVDDNVDQGGFQRSAIVHTVATTEDSTYASAFMPDAVVTLVDDETSGVTITESGGSTSVTEAAGAGNTDTYTVVLDTKPTAAVEVETGVVTHNRDMATVSPATLTFTTGNWDTAQTVTVTGTDDNVDQPRNRRLATITNQAFSSGGNRDRRYDRIPVPNVIVTVVDDDGPGVTIIESMGDTRVTEASGAGQSDTYTVVLNRQPGAGVEIAVASGDTGAATVSPATLTFTTSNWNTAQPVTVTGVDNTVARDTRRAVISHTATSTDVAYSGTIIDIVTATVVDDDGSGVTINESNDSTSVTEASGAGNTDTYTVVLDTRPSASVEIVVASDVAAATVNPATLTFTASNWQSAQTVTVTGVDDNVDQDGKRTATISHTATSTDANYEGVPIDDVAAAVVDNDGSGVTIIESNGSTTVTEAFGAGNTDTYTVVLDSLPAGTVAIHVQSSDSSLVTATPATLTFTTSNWNMAQTVTVAGMDDDDTQTGNSIAVINHVISTSDGSDYDYSTSRSIESVTVTLVDDDLPVISISLPTFEGLSRRGGLYYFPEGEGLFISGRGFSVSASLAPTQDLTICLNLTETGANRMVSAGTQGKGLITFTLPANTPSGDQSISWSDNNDDDQNSQVTLTAVPPSDSNCSQTGYTVSLTENSQSWFIEDDDPTVVELTSSDTRMSEGNASATATATITLSRPLLSGEMINLPLTLTTTTGASLPGSATPDFAVSASGKGVTTSVPTSTTPTVVLAGADSQTVQTALVTFTPTSRDDGDSSHEAINAALPGSAVLLTTQRALSLSNLGGRATRGTNFDVDLTLEDDEAPTVQFGATSYSGGEVSGSRTVNVGLTASPAFGSATSLTYAVGGTATPGTDYTALSGTVSMTGGSGTITITITDDLVDDADETIVLTLNPSNDYSLGSRESTTITIADDDGPAVNIMETDGSTEVTEGRSDDTYTVVLNSLPTHAVEISTSSGDATIVTASPATLTFTTGNWNTAQTVTLTGVDNNRIEDARSAAISHTATSSDARYNGIDIDDVTVMVQEDDNAGLDFIGSGSLSVTEASGAGQTDTYTVDLQTVPTANVEIIITSDDEGSVTVNPATLTFTSGDWNTPKTVTVTGVDDNVDQDQTRTVNISHAFRSTDPDYKRLADADVTISRSVTVTDNDTSAVTIAETSGSTSVSEASGAGRTDTYTVVLATLPSASVEITVTSGDTAVATVSPATLTFTTGNTPQTVTVTGVDDNVDQTGNRSATITHVATSTDAKYNGITIASVAATVVDDDESGATINELGGVSVTEASGAGRTDTYTVVLATLPSASVEITVTSGDTAKATVSPSTLTFTTGNWNTPQAVTVTGVDDNVDQTGNRSATISHSATSTDTRYNGVVIASVTATVVDNDGAGVTINELGGVSVTEAAGAGRTDTYTVVLATLPSASVEITITSGDTAAATVSPSTLTFTTGNWNTAQTVTVTGVDDNLYQSSGRRATISHSATSSDSVYHTIAIADVTATVVDDDAATIGISDSGGVSVSEAAGAGRTDTYTVVLDSLPTASVEIAVASGDTAAATVSPAALTFTTSNWNTARTVTVTGVDDRVDQSSDRMVAISHTATSSDTGYNGVSASVTVTVVDDDTASIAINESGGVMVTEATGTDRTDTYTATLASQPTASVEIAVTSGDTAAATVSPAALTFTASNWQTAQTLTVTGVDDTVDQSSDRMVTISHTATSTDTGYNGLSASVTATVVDNDTVGVTITESGSPPATSVDEFIDGLTDTYTVVLDSEPAASVEIAVTSGDTGAATVSPATLTFTTSNWQTAQTVTVTGVDDGVDQSSDRTATISHSATSTDPLYSGIGIDDVTVTVVDDDMVGVTIIETDGTTMVTEASGPAHTDTYTVALGNRPTSTVTIAMGLNPSGAVTVSPATLTFTSSSWKAAQTVTVTAVDDEVDQEERRTVRITHPLVSSDVRYTTIASPRITAVVVDNDSTLLTFSHSVDDDNSSGTPDIISDPSPTVTEAPGPAQADTYTLALTAWPGQAEVVTVAMVSSDPGAATMDPATLTFTPSNWGTPQTVTVTGVDDGVDQSGNRTVTITHTPASDSGRRIPTLSTLVTVVDNDTEVGITADDHDGTIPEGEPARFTLTATPAPAAEQTIDVNVRITDSGRFAVSSQTGGRVFTITASGTVSFSIPTEDDMNPEGDGRITATVETGRGYRPHGSNASASITVEDDFDAPPSVVPSTEMLTVAEGDTASYTIMLDARPASGVAVSTSVRREDGTVLTSTAASPGGSPGDGSSGVDGEAVVSVNPTLFTFRPTDWSTPQAVTITVPPGAGFAGETITLSHTVSRGHHQGPMTDVLVGVVADGDAAALVEQRKRAWHLRFGRTVSQQVVDALQQRLTTPPEAGLELTVAGETLTSPTASPPLAEQEGLLAKALGFNTVTSQALLEGSSFKFAPHQQEETPRLGFWGQGALSSFDGEEDGSSLEGDVTTLLLGTDWSTGRWQAGAALSQSWSSGSYEGDNEDVADGHISSVLTGVFPYGRYALTPRLGLWATAGYGWGELSLEPDGEEDEYTPGTTMAMTAAGLDGALLNGGNGAGITLNATADVMTVKTTSEEADGLPSSEGLFSRLRLGLEAARPFPLPQGASLLPSMEVGMRYDSGDAETGYGLDLGAGILWSAPEYGISGELKGHTLLTHQEEAFREQGLALSFSWEPHPSDRGPSLSLSHTMGATASGGMDALLNPATIQVLDASTTTGQQFGVELAYGFPAYQDRITLTPAVALALSPTTRNYSLLWSVAPYAQQRQATPWEVSLEGEWQEQNSSSPVDHSLKLRFSTLF